MGRLMVLREKTDAATEHERRKLEVTSALNLGEQVNQIRPLDVTVDENTVVWPKAFLGTVWKSSFFLPLPFLDLSSYPY